MPQNSVNHSTILTEDKAMQPTGFPATENTTAYILKRVPGVIS